MKEIAKITIKPTELVSEGSWGARSLGKHESTMTLYSEEPKTYAMIEWDIPSLDEVEQIGLWFEGKTLTEYDGVMSLPREAIQFLRKQGYTVPREFE